jgi:hypothetical protein
LAAEFDAIEGSRGPKMSLDLKDGKKATGQFLGGVAGTIDSSNA